ncbi:MAG: hypothetical protein HOV94_01075 [Saccharothrix sp.]|nr:hypothetical protein [Saccharothrix sp.]
MRLREWTVDDAAWYAEATRDPEVQRHTADPPTLTAAQVAAAVEERCGNVAVDVEDGIGHVSYQDREIEGAVWPAVAYRLVP